MTALELARLQFTITTLFHFIFVPLSIGMAFFTATFQTLHYRTGDQKYRTLTRFFGKLMLISFAVGVVTGIVQEFQFGMNWSEYSRYVGDIFGAPLAIEGLAAFFLESTFIGLWIFGWDRLSPKVHLLTIWMVSIGTMLSAYFILAANSWMQHPVGVKVNPISGRAEMTSIFDVLTNNTALYAFSHTILAAFATAGMVIIAVCAYQLLKGRDKAVFMPAMKIALGVTFVAVILTSFVGHFQGVLLEKQQPMKMAAAEALWETEKGAGLSIFAVAGFERDPGGTDVNIEIPYMLSLISSNNPNSTVRGMNEVQEEYRQRYGPGDYIPIVAITYWMFRAMIGFGVLMILLTGIGLWLHRKGKLEQSRRYLWLMIPAAALPFLANFAGWIFTEVGRQPWVVQGLLKTAEGVSVNVSNWAVALTMIGFTLIYGTLGIIGGKLFWRFAKDEPKVESQSDIESGKSALAISY